MTKFLTKIFVLSFSLYGPLAIAGVVEGGLNQSEPRSCKSNATIEHLLRTFNRAKKKQSQGLMSAFNQAVFSTSHSLQDYLCLLEYDFGWEVNAYVVEQITKLGQGDARTMAYFQSKMESCQGEGKTACEEDLSKYAAVFDALRFGAVLCADYSECGLSRKGYLRAVSYHILKMRHAKMDDKAFLAESEILIENYAYFLETQAEREQ